MGPLSTLVAAIPFGVCLTSTGFVQASDAVVVPTCSANTSRLKLVTTANNGGGWICFGRMRLSDDGTDVPFPSGTTTTNTGVFTSQHYHSDNLYLPHDESEYCSESGSFQAGRGHEEVELILPSAVAFDAFSMTRALPYSNNDFVNVPRDFALLGMDANGRWVELRNETNFDFGNNDVASFQVRCPTAMPTSSPTLSAPWIISFLDILTDFTPTSIDELSLMYEVGKGRELDTFLYQEDCAEDITDIAITLNATRTSKNTTMDSLTLKYDIPKADIANSSIWSSTAEEIQICQVVKLIIPPTNDTEKLNIVSDYRKLSISFNLSASFNITNGLAPSQIENVTGSADLSSYIIACKCSSSSFACNSDALAPNEELHVCVTSTDDDVEVARMVSMAVSQGAEDLEVVAGGVPAIPGITSIDYDDDGARVGTRVPINLFDFAAGRSLRVAGAVEMRLGGSGRRLAALVGEGAGAVDGGEEASYNLLVALEEGSDLGLVGRGPVSPGRKLIALEPAVLVVISTLIPLYVW